MMVTLNLLIETPKMPDLDRYALSSDLISELLTGMRLRGVQYRRVQTGPSFGFALDAKPGHAYFYFLGAGQAVIRMCDGTSHELATGSAVFIPQGEAHHVLSSAEMAAEDIESFDAVPLGEAVSGLDTCPSTHAVPSAVLFVGCMAFDLGAMHGLGKLMPAVMLADTQAARYPGLLPILDAMKKEICAGRIGYAGILARLAEVAAAMIVRGWIEGGCENASGLVAALRDPRLARALLALHRQPGHEWSVAELAAASHTSRSVFAQRFQSTLGVSPLRYVAALRMRLATQWLTHDRLAIDVVAQRLGYTSQAAFSRAFKRINGQSPGASRHLNVRQSGSSVR